MLRVLTCKTCSATFELHITKEQWKSWREGELIQNVMPHLTIDERELIISGICGNCFDKMFAEDESECKCTSYTSPSCIVHRDEYNETCNK